MVGLEYKWLADRARLARASLLTLGLAAAAALALAAAGPRSASFPAALAPAAVALHEPTPSDLPAVVVRLWILAPQLLSRR
jgi:hypothetical protein